MTPINRQSGRAPRAQNHYEMTMVLPDFTVDQLKQLPLRAMVAFAARCARRVEQFAQLPEGHADRERRRSAVEAALRLAEGFCGGSDVPPEKSVVEAIEATLGVAGTPLGTKEAAAAVAGVAHAAALAWELIGSQQQQRAERPGRETAEAKKFLGALATVTADLAALDAFTAAQEAFSAVGYSNEEFVAAALNDYNALLRLNLGHYPEAGAPIDPTPSGPLGRF